MRQLLSQRQSRYSSGRWRSFALKISRDARTLIRDCSLLRKDIADFSRIVGRYSRKRLHEGWVWFERKKDIVVNFLVAKRGLYQRPFLHTSFFALAGIGIVMGPIIANSYPSEASSQLDAFIPPSAVLSSFDEQEVSTQVSDKPRDQIILHVIESGDTLEALAQKYGVSVDSIRWANEDLKGDKLMSGEELKIPPVSGVVLKVKRGDTIYSLAKKYNSDAQKILNWPFNDFADLDNFTLIAGQTLVIPDGVVPKAQPKYSPRTIAEVGINPGTGQFIWPTRGSISQHPVSYHMALDIANRSLPAIAAADGGTVTSVEYLRYGYGHHVIIDHGNGFQTLYGHMSEIYVSAGQAVSKGSTIGKMGSTGRSSGPHLHLEVRKNGVLQNPLSFLGN